MVLLVCVWCVYCSREGAYNSGVVAVGGGSCVGFVVGVVVVVFCML